MMRWCSYQVVLVYLLELGLLTVAAAANDPCDSKHVLPDMDKRGINSTLGQSGHIIDDHYNIPAEGQWYRVESQHMLNNVSFIHELKACGTVFPIYLNGSLPQRQDGIVDRVVCTVGFGSLCQHPMNIKIKMCRDFSVYFLKRPASTSSAFCFLYPENTLPPKFDILKPTVNVSLVNKISPVFHVDLQSLQFICDFTLLSEDLLYEVIWYIDGKAISETKIANRTEIEQLVLEEQPGQLERLGVNVACAVRTRLTPNDVPGMLSPRSDPFYAGITTTPSVTLHRESPTTYIVVKPTVPVGCPTLFQDVCEVVVELILPETYKCRGSIGAVLPTGAQTCGKHIRHDEWDKEHNIYIAWLDDQTYNGHPDNYKVSLRTAINNYHPIWSNVVLGDVNVIMEDNSHLWKGKECHAICDPHMKTFDGRNYENQNDGTFIFYENDDPNKKVQVQMKVTPCNAPAHVFCVCAIAVRAGGDVFVIDSCPGIYRPIFEFRSCEDHILDVRKINEHFYKIYLPSGTYLSARLWHYTGKDVMDLHMFPSAADTFHTRGLCGTLNGRTDDDFTKPNGQITGDNNIFAKSWSVTDEDENLITMSADNLAKLATWNKTENTQFCTCNGPSRNISCTHGAIATCVRDDESPVVKKKGCLLKRSRSLRPISSIPHTTQPSIVDPQQQIWNMSTATAYCEKIMKDSTSFHACAEQVPATDPGNSIDTCVLDIMATQTTMWATSARESLKSVCLKELKQNTTYQEEDSPDRPSIAQQIKEITCANECSGYGQCDNGTCVCIAYFGTADCSVDIRIPPDTHGVNLDTNSTCDLNVCSMAIVEGDTFVDTATLTCHITLYKIHTDDTEELYKQFTTSGQFNTLMEVFCPLPHTRSLPSSDEFAQRWSIGVSNDGQNFGKESDLIVYNGGCQKVEHDNVSSVLMQDNFCFIRGVCVPEGNINPTESCWICQISDPASRYQWSRNPGNCLINGVCIADGEVKRHDNCSRCDVSVSIDQWTANIVNVDCKDKLKETTTAGAVLPFFEIHKPTVNVSLVNTFSTVFNVDVQGLQFVCGFKLLDEDLLYEVIWYIDGKAINETKIANRTELEQLVLEEGAGQLEQLGVNVACTVRARLLPDGVFGRVSPTSDPFYAGIKSTPSVTLHRETPTAYIVVKPTVPIGCPAFFQDGCEVVVELLLPETYKCRANIGAVLPTGAQTCGKHIRHDEWDQEHKIYIAWLDDQTYNGHPDSYKVSLRTAVNNYNPIWSNVVLDVVNVVMDDNTNLWKGKECHAICDPHMKTFDGRNYENQNPGTFILYENDDPNKKVQVQMKVTPCNPPAHVFCVCAIAVRAGGDVFVIDRCPGIYRPIFEFRTCEDHILDVRKINEHFYKIYLPSGTYLSTKLMHYTGKDVMDLHMYPSAADTFHTRGLCGTLNGQTDDDFAEPDGQITGDNNIFSRSWSVTDGENLITMSADALEKLATWNKTDNAQFCTCNGPSRNISCTPGAIATCVRDDESPVVKQKGCRVRKSRSFLPISLMPNTTPPVLVGPQQQIWNMTKATDYCEKYLRDSTSFDACAKQVPATDPGNAIDTCVLDIMATQTTMWATSARESMKSVCLKELKQNTTYQEEDSDDQPSIARQIKEITCPNECDGHGQCDNGTCVCSTYFGAADCSVDIRKPPHIYGVNLDTNNTCDLNVCQTAIVEGETFIDTSSLTCHNTLYQIHSNGTETNFLQWTSHAQFNTLVEVFCPTPYALSHQDKNRFAYRWSVGVSNDGQHFGNVSDLIVYDGICQNVVQNGTLSVEMEVNFCFIDGVCIPEGNTHPSDLCHVCQAADPRLRFQWSRNPGYCLINGECIVDGQAKSDDNCSSCDVSISLDQWISLTGHVDCDGRQSNTSIFGLKNETYNTKEN
ncbi:uncharacterized protein LOC110466572 isoform X3 [Mizuhopecten yessoensis]|uniref:uncharacterized protein LOC110466572 isoform X3 n=1 Tax=Mizuhopecten yessoensis TaxID=6573 RepID=UPI000B45A7EE|nr:uncharacterized protein LOC110466572 isoform X3 [Mizuhopecten yessoensis]